MYIGDENMANYEKRIKKNIEKNNQKPELPQNKKQIRNLIKIFACVSVIIVAIIVITYFVQK